MYYELYIDVLFLQNLILDYLLLHLVKRLTGCSTTQLRMVLASVFGSMAFCILCIFSLAWTLPGMLFSYVGISALMIIIGFSLKTRRQLVSSVVMLYVCSLLLGGCITWLEEAIPVLPFACHAVVGLLCLEFLSRWLFRFQKQKRVSCKVVLQYKGACQSLTALWDTGNRLWDPLHGKPVSVVERKTLEPKIEEEELLFSIPCRSVGNANGMLSALIADYLTIQMEGQVYVIKRPVLGITEEPLSSDGSYDLILNPDLIDN